MLCVSRDRTVKLPLVRQLCFIILVTAVPLVVGLSIRLPAQGRDSYQIPKHIDLVGDLLQLCLCVNGNNRLVPAAKKSARMMKRSDVK